MKRIEPTMPSEKTLQKISLATGDFKQMYQAPVEKALEEQDAKQYPNTLDQMFFEYMSEEEKERFLYALDPYALDQSVEEQDLELDENYYLINQLSPLSYKAAQEA